jgi:hypothetical protein
MKTLLMEILRATFLPRDGSGSLASPVAVAGVLAGA